MQTLDLGTKPNERTGPPEIGLPWSLLFIPALIFLAGLSIPYAFVGSRIQRRRERSFCLEMKARDRVIEWPEFQRRIDKGHGTLIVEHHSLKGPMRWWWTPEDVYSLCPHLIVYWTMKMHNDESYRPLAEWCHLKYTSPVEGHAHLVAHIPDRVLVSPEDLLGEGLNRMKWLDVVPPERLREYQARPGDRDF
jgi:hypothetical protein